MINKKARIIIAFAAVIVLGYFLYGRVLSELMMSALHREGSSHGLFIPVISAYFLWQRWEKIKSVESRAALLPGITIISMSFLILYLARGSTNITVGALSFIMMLTGMVLLLFGTKIFKEVCFPLLFLITMIPLPQPVYARIADLMRASCTYGSTYIMGLLGIPFYREGYTIHLANTELFVAESCSGIRYLLSYFVFGVAYAFIFKERVQSRILVLILIIPISVIAGILRLTAIFLSAYFIGAFMADHGPHIRISWLVFAVVLIVCIVIDRKWFHSQHNRI